MITFRGFFYSVVNIYIYKKKKKNRNILFMVENVINFKRFLVLRDYNFFFH